MNTLTIIYPFYYFLNKTFIGKLIMILATLSPIPIAIHITYPELLTQQNDNETIGLCIAVATITLSPFVATIFMTINDKLEAKYNSQLTENITEETS